MTRLIVLFLAALSLSGCAGAYVAGDVGAHHDDLDRLNAASPPMPAGASTQRLALERQPIALTWSPSSQR